MDSDSTRDDVEARLHETAEAMSDRFESLQDEVSTTRTSLRDWVVRNPWKSVGGMLAAGVAVGAVFGGGGSRRGEQSELLEQYIQALRTEVEEGIAGGDSPGQAVEKALQGRAPLVVYRGEDAGGDGKKSGSLLGQGLRFASRLVFREVIREAVLSWLDDVDASDMIDEDILE